MDPDLLAELRPVRLPPGFELLDWQGMLAVFSVGILLGLVVAFAIRLVSEPKPSIKRTVASRLAGARELPAGERLLVQSRTLELLETAASSRPRAKQPAAMSGLDCLREKIGRAIYQPAPDLDCDHIDRELLDLAAKARA